MCAQLLTRDKNVLRCRNFSFLLGNKTYIMGIVNLTPDSFSGDGLYKDKGKAEAVALRLQAEGADIIDLGGESTRPGAEAISVREEIDRVIPVLKRLKKNLRIAISVDTYKHQVAQAALDSGASIINDVTALRDEKMAAVIARYSAGVVLMHMQGQPRTMQQNPQYKNLLKDLTDYLKRAAELAKGAGIPEESIIIDPGIGFGKTVEQNLTILKKLSYFKRMGFPILVGTSRKSLIGKVLNLPVEERIFGTAATVAESIAGGADIVRVHEVRAMREVARMTDAIVRLKDD
jgi:dihydropteroate synthase